MTEPETAGIVSRGDAAVIGAHRSALPRLVLSRLLFNPTGFRLPALDVLFSTAVVLTVSALYLAVAVDRRRRSVQDILLGTRVVYVRR